MSITIINIAISILFILGFSNFASAFAVSSLTVNFALIAVILSCQASLPAAIVTVLILGYMSDSLASGPPGLYFLWVVVLFFIIRPILTYLKPQKVISAALCAAVAAAVFDIGYGLTIAILYPESSIVSLIPMQLWKDALATGLMAPICTIIVTALNALWMKRSKSSKTLR